MFTFQASVEWFRIYKIPAGKPANEFAFNGKFKDREFAEKVIDETHEFWKALIKEKDPKLNTWVLFLCNVLILRLHFVF